MKRPDDTIARSNNQIDAGKANSSRQNDEHGSQQDEDVIDQPNNQRTGRRDAKSTSL
jgi:hypothetical protein